MLYVLLLLTHNQTLTVVAYPQVEIYEFEIFTIHHHLTSYQRPRPCIYRGSARTHNNSKLSTLCCFPFGFFRDFIYRVSLFFCTRKTTSDRCQHSTSRRVAQNLHHFACNAQSITCNHENINLLHRIPWKYLQIKYSRID